MILTFYKIHFFLFMLRIFSDRFDTNGSRIARSVPEIHCTPVFVTRRRTEEELGILVSGILTPIVIILAVEGKLSVH